MSANRAGYTERSLPALASKIGELMNEGLAYDDAIVAACVALPPKVAEGSRAETLGRRIETKLFEIAAVDFAPRLPMAYDDWLDAVLVFCEGDDEDPIYFLLLRFAEFG